eukprot:CAMPEP_0204833724 /NCGR_PEP_ID=MMETSP1346-20131115/17604_1 /ASSEMBLY_ACC=CAM_ASM_000771 /TAXON_ID=215587 /ORGANISM="Aplanochytrium stocchinoi, Strain GSBS06" /LENGTH=168 /DNA_ID=CAMNT_0051966467 /DNA_START=20 /DNA_END=523 /DNA_ORIENTATION=+
MTDSSGQVFYKFRSSTFATGQNLKHFENAGTSHAITVQIPQRKPDVVVAFKTYSNQNLMYRLTGDFNNVHIEQKLASKLGYEKPILHGLAFLGIAARCVLKTYGGNDADAFKAMNVRFSKPVIPGQTLETEMWLQPGINFSRVIFQTRCKETGQLCITNAFMEIHKDK